MSSVKEYGFTRVEFTSLSKEKLSGLLGVMKEFCKENQYVKDRSLYKLVSNMTDLGTITSYDLPKYNDSSFIINIDDEIGCVEDTFHFGIFLYDFPRPNEELLNIIIGDKGIDYVYRTENLSLKLFINTDTSHKIIQEKYLVEVYDGEADDMGVLYFKSKGEMIANLDCSFNLDLRDTMSIRAINKALEISDTKGCQLIVHAFQPK